MTSDNLEQRAARGDRAKFEQALAKVGNGPPDAHDLIAPGHDDLDTTPVMLSDLQCRLLTDANEDYTDLTVAVLETVGQEASTVAEKYAAADGALRQLLEWGLVCLYRTDDEQTYEAVRPDEVDAVLSHPNSWFPMYPAYWTAFAATEEGARVWKSGLFRRR